MRDIKDISYVNIQFAIDDIAEKEFFNYKDENDKKILIETMIETFKPHVLASDGQNYLLRNQIDNSVYFIWNYAIYTAQCDDFDYMTDYDKLLQVYLNEKNI